MHHTLIFHNSDNAGGADDTLQYYAQIIEAGDDAASIILNADDLIFSGVSSTPIDLSFILLENIGIKVSSSGLNQSEYFGQYFAKDANGQEIGTLFWNITSLDAELIPTSPIPVPSAVWLFCSCLVGFIGMRKKALKTPVLSA